MIQEDFSLQNSENYKPYEQSIELVEFLKNQFGFPDDLFVGKSFYTIENSNIVYMLNSELDFHYKVTQIGIPVFKGEFPKGYVTNNFIYRYGKLAKKNVIEVDDNSIMTLLNREGISLSEENCSKGHHILKSGQKILGRGWIREGMLYFDGSKIWRQNLLDN